MKCADSAEGTIRFRKCGVNEHPRFFRETWSETRTAGRGCIHHETTHFCAFHNCGRFARRHPYRSRRRSTASDNPWQFFRSRTLARRFHDTGHNKSGPAILGWKWEKRHAG